MISKNRMMNINYKYTILYVSDVDRALTFYERAFGFERKMLTPEGDYGELTTGDTTIAFADHTLGASNFPDGFERSAADRKPFGIELAFTTEDVQSAVDQALVHGATLLSPVTAKPWGQEVAYVRDPSGFIVELCTPMG